MITKISDNELMQSFYNMIPYFKYYVGEEVGFTISNTSDFLLVKNTEKLRINFKAGDRIPEGCAADVCLRKKEVIDIIVPEKVFGFPVRTIGIPVFADGKIEGTMVMSMGIDKTKKIAELSNGLSHSLSKINSSVVEMTRVFQQIDQANSGIENFIQDAKEEYKKTDDVLNFISGVARKTNLLGLNASIEAARAGVAGRGFSVVSTEIGKLSVSTKESVAQISDITGSIQSSINEIYERFQGSNDLLDSQIQVLEEIKAMIEKLNQDAAVLNDFAKI